MYHIPYCVQLLNMLGKITFRFLRHSIRVLKKIHIQNFINVKILICNTDRSCRSVLHLCRSDMLIKIYCKFFARFLVKLFCFFHHPCFGSKQEAFMWQQMSKKQTVDTSNKDNKFTCLHFLLFSQDTTFVLQILTSRNYFLQPSTNHKNGLSNPYLKSWTLAKHYAFPKYLLRGGFQFLYHFEALI